MLQQAEKFYEQMEYAAALQALIRVHQVKGVGPMQRARSFLYMGVCFTAQGKAEDAVQSFMALLKLKPDFRLPKGVSPSIRAMFKEALLRLKMPSRAPPPKQGGPGRPGPGGKPPVEVEAKAPRKVIAGSPIEVTINITDPRKLVTHVTIRWRKVKGGEYSSVKVKVKPGQKVVKGMIPAVTLKRKRGKVVYFVEALARGSMTVAHDGSMDEPLVVRLKRPKKKSNAKWWVIGIGAGLAVAGGVVAAILLTRPDTPQPVYPSAVQPPIILK